MVSHAACRGLRDKAFYYYWDSNRVRYMASGIPI